jgi:hypothetical protein
LQRFSIYQHLSQESRAVSHRTRAFLEDAAQSRAGSERDTGGTAHRSRAEPVRAWMRAAHSDTVARAAPCTFSCRAGGTSRRLEHLAFSRLDEKKAQCRAPRAS